MAGDEHTTDTEDQLLDGLSPAQHQAIIALLNKSSIAAAARAARVGERTLHTWLDDPTFYRAYLAARRRVMQQTIAQLQQASGDAVTTLATICNDKKAAAPARIAAARAILEYANRGLELEDYDQRLAHLERRLDGASGDG